MNNGNTESVTKQLAELGLRLAVEGESGWYVTVLVAGCVKKVWATDEVTP